MDIIKNEARDTLFTAYSRMAHLTWLAIQAGRASDAGAFARNTVTVWNRFRDADQREAQRAEYLRLETVAFNEEPEIYYGRPVGAAA